METILEFIKKWGMLICVLLCMVITVNTCGVKGSVKGNNKRLDKLEQTVAYNDSLNRVIRNLERDIIVCETSKEVLFSWNSVIRTVNRPDDLMNQYDQKLKALNAQLEAAQNAKK